jgi:uncharacterized membrane protein
MGGRERVVPAPSLKGPLRHRLFQVGVVLKGLDGALEIGGAVLLAIFGASGVSRVGRFLTQHELSEDPHDVVAGWVVRHTRELGHSTVEFAIAYLMVHGVVKLVLAGGLIRERLRIFPWALGFLGLFIVYQGYRLVVGFSGSFAFLTGLDIAIVVLVWQEYRDLRSRQGGAGVA